MTSQNTTNSQGCGVGQRLQEVLSTLPCGVKLVAISKYHPASEIAEAYSEGQRIFGESHEQELACKHEALPKDIRWHFIGHLQTNKVKFIVPYISMVESVDSLRLLREIEKQAARCGRTIDVLLEIHVAQEDTKYGLSPDECRQLLADGEWHDMSHVRIRGLMAMASFTDDENQIRTEFNAAAELFDELKQRHFATDDFFSERSWGMSSDYRIAIECRSTMVRIGTAIFGERERK